MLMTLLRVLLPSALLAMLTLTVPEQPSISEGSPLFADGDYIMRTQTGCEAAKAPSVTCRRFLSWDRTETSAAVVTVEAADPAVWRFERIAENEYRISSRWGCPDDPLCDAPLSWVERSPDRREAILTGGRLSTWSLERASNGSLRIRSQLGCPDGPGCGNALSLPVGTSSRGRVTLTHGAAALWFIESVR